MDLHRDLTDLLTEFASSGVRYLVVGGWAVGVHAEPRYTKVLDLLIDGSSDNTERVLQALKAYGAPAGLIEEVQTMTDDEFVFFGAPLARVDLMRQIPGVDFVQAWGHRKDVNWQGTTVHIDRNRCPHRLEARRRATEGPRRRTAWRPCGATAPEA